MARIVALSAALCVGFGFVSSTLAAEAAQRSGVSKELREKSSQAIDRAVDFLRKQQLDDGRFADGANAPAITSLVVTGLLKSGHVTASDPMVSKALGYLEKHVQPDGGIYLEGGRKNYPTAIATMAFAAANTNDQYRSLLDNAVKFLKKEQWDESEGITPEDARYGGAGYGRKTRPDLSNTAFLLEALRDSGLSKDDPAFKRAQLFISRCQNLTGEGANDLPQAAKIDDGGFYYTPAEDYNPGGGTTGAGLRSYGSMTYTGLKSFIYAGVGPDDRRVKAALGWIKRHYTLKENPGLGAQGLYYYYHTFAKALAALELDELVDVDGVHHDWRGDLVKQLLAKQQPNGSWINENPRWLENDPTLVTAYVLLTLDATMGKK
ncbi:A-macroglobulin complement component [Planctomycetes bacterium Pan216]|uniref:A-macroglobulin complement component n=1 Tax=Kolteria novifilia TaxID=2527975 RepID=A0A518BAN0_9BACT|nr:A-macroglobulin complement component [Planctomycetes bacterium Pan216]